MAPGTTQRTCAGRGVERGSSTHPTFAAQDDLLGAYLTQPSLHGTAGGDQLVGTSGADWLVGAAGDDHLLGGDGRDVLEGGSGNDRLEGGAGDDRYLFKSGDGGLGTTIHDTEGSNMAVLDGFSGASVQGIKSGQNLVVVVNNAPDLHLRGLRRPRAGVRGRAERGPVYRDGGSARLSRWQREGTNRAASRDRQLYDAADVVEPEQAWKTGGYPPSAPQPEPGRSSIRTRARHRMVDACWSGVLDRKSSATRVAADFRASEPTVRRWLARGRAARRPSMTAAQALVLRLPPEQLAAFKALRRQRPIARRLGLPDSTVCWRAVRAAQIAVEPSGRGRGASTYCARRSPSSRPRRQRTS